MSKPSDIVHKLVLAWKREHDVDSEKNNAYALGQLTQRAIEWLEQNEALKVQLSMLRARMEAAQAKVKEMQEIVED